MATKFIFRETPSASSGSPTAFPANSFYSGEEAALGPILGVWLNEHLKEKGPDRRKGLYFFWAHRPRVTLFLHQELVWLAKRITRHLLLFQRLSNETGGKRMAGERGLITTLYPVISDCSEFEAYVCGILPDWIDACRKVSLPKAKMTEDKIFF